MLGLFLRRSGQVMMKIVARAEALLNMLVAAAPPDTGGGNLVIVIED